MVSGMCYWMSPLHSSPPSTHPLADAAGSMQMPFSICSTPEVFQHRIHQLIEGLHGVEVVADDLVGVGFGDTEKKAIVDHDQNVDAFLQQCEQSGLKLNLEKVQLRKKEVLFIGHVATEQSLCTDPAKVQVIREVPLPTDFAGLRHLLGLTQHLTLRNPCNSSLSRTLSGCGTMHSKGLLTRRKMRSQTHQRCATTTWRRGLHSPG